MEADLMAFGDGFAQLFAAPGGGGLSPLIWVIAILVAAFSIVFVYLILAFIVPAKNSPARHFIKAKREKKPVFFLDAGKFFKCVVGDHPVGQEKAQVFRHGQDVIKGDQGLKYCEGILMGIGEDFRSLTANIAIVDLMDMINTKEWKPDEIKERLEKLSSELKKSLGFEDGVKSLKILHAENLAKINAKYDAMREDIVTEHTVPVDEEVDPDAEETAAEDNDQ